MRPIVVGIIVLVVSTVLFISLFRWLESLDVDPIPVLESANHLPARQAVDGSPRFRYVYKKGATAPGPNVTIVEDTETGCLYFGHKWQPVLDDTGKPAGCDSENVRANGWNRPRYGAFIDELSIGCADVGKIMDCWGQGNSKKGTN